MKKVQKKSKKKQITWLDFKGKPNYNSSWQAETYWNISYNYKTTEIQNNDKKVIVSVKGGCTFLSKLSWVKIKSKELLNHEIGHYNIGLLCWRDFKYRINLISEFDKNSYKTQIDNIFRNTLKIYLEIEKIYDENTQHMANKKNQEIWDYLIKKKLCEYN